jgi:hypoxanthine phosphoribosyltransferase
VTAGRSEQYTAGRIATQVKALGRKITAGCQGRRLDVVVTMDRGFMFAADLIRAIDAPVAIHFLRENVQDVEQAGRARREVFFSSREAMAAGGEESKFKGRDVLLVDIVLDSGATQDFVLRRLGEGKPRSLRLAVLLDKTSQRKVDLEPDYFGFRTTSNVMWTGYGLSASNSLGGNGKHLAVAAKGKTRAKKARKKKKK